MTSRCQRYSRRGLVKGNSNLDFSLVTERI